MTKELLVDKFGCLGEYIENFYISPKLIGSELAHPPWCNFIFQGRKPPRKRLDGQKKDTLQKQKRKEVIN